MEVKGISLLCIAGVAWIPTFFVLSFRIAAGANLPYRAVNLGGWLAVEGWMKPSLFDGIVNKDLLDGTEVQFQSIGLRKYICAENGGGSIIVANRTSASGWETFRLWRINSTAFNFRVFDKKFITINGAKVVATSQSPLELEAFHIVRDRREPNRVRIKAANGKFLQVKTETLVTADGGRRSWHDGDRSVFNMTIVSRLQGEYQLTNGYGRRKAAKVMKDHWNTFITEKDFRFISRNGLNAVRIPVGWWIASGDNPPKPFVGGSLSALDVAFNWAKKYCIKIIVDLHGAHGSQNGYEHSAARDGYIEWGDSKINETAAVIEFLASRYAAHPSFGAISLLNEPRSEGISLGTLVEYYKAGYEAVRRHSTGFVILSNRLGDEVGQRELVPFAKGLLNVAIDVHYYNLFSDVFDNMTVQQNIDFITQNRSSDLQNITVHGPLSFVGEWTGEMAIGNTTREDHRRFNEAQIEVYGKATFGWAYWSYKCFQKHWSLEWMVKHDYLNL